MELTVRQISSLEKIRSVSDIPKDNISAKTLLGGERFSYQIALASKENCDIIVSLSSALADHVHLYAAESVVMDYPVCPHFKDDAIITDQPGVMPDVLIPLELTGHLIRTNSSVASLWVEVVIPKGFASGNYAIDISFDIKNAANSGDAATVSQRMNIAVLGIDLPEQSTIFTQWFHVDCIASAHNVDIYSEEHWRLIDKYMALASELGVNMILTPVITPPIDTGVGIMRPCTQLVRIEKQGESYSFDFALLERWILLCKRNNFKYYEISHLFSQWGLEYSPNIRVSENGENVHMFGWHVPAQDDTYRAFLKQFIPALVEFLKSQGIFDKCYFHLSDEPRPEHIKNYRYAHDLVVPMLSGAKTIDALSDVNLYREGLVSVPVTAIDHIEPFLKEKIENRWAYYCCSQSIKVSNRFLTFPSYRNRIIGIQLYKHGIKGFLQWGFNFYYSRLSLHEINPYLMSSGNKAFPSGDAFSVYPYKDSPIPSLRALVFKEALQEIDLLKLLESYIGRDKVLELIECEAGMDITFKEYPQNSEFLPALNDKIKEVLKNLSA